MADNSIPPLKTMLPETLSFEGHDSSLRENRPVAVQGDWWANFPSGKARKMEEWWNKGVFRASYIRSEALNGYLTCAKGSMDLQRLYVRDMDDGERVSLDSSTYQSFRLNAESIEEMRPLGNGSIDGEPVQVVVVGSIRSL
ncbi:hypothetical protein PM082_009465 [Marasmius tenuissimus]|nr:hypothetical protein PM082_009465 [Marasmius tenuissimus]